MIDRKVEEVVRRVFQLDDKRSLDDVAPGSIPQWDSLGHVSLIHAVEEEFGLKFSVDEIATIDSIASLKEVLKSHVS